MRDPCFGERTKKRGNIQENKKKTMGNYDMELLKKINCIYYVI